MRWALTVSGEPELGVLVFTLSSALSQTSPSKFIPKSPSPADIKYVLCARY